MRTIVNNTPKEESFPKLMIHHDTGIIILATSRIGFDITGVVVSATAKSSYYVGYHRSNWGSTFVDFEGSITLSND